MAMIRGLLLSPFLFILHNCNNVNALRPEMLAFELKVEDDESCLGTCHPRNQARHQGEFSVALQDVQAVGYGSYFITETSCQNGPLGSDSMVSVVPRLDEENPINNSDLLISVEPRELAHLHGDRLQICVAENDERRCLCRRSDWHKQSVCMGSGSRKDTRFEKVLRDCLKIQKVSKVQRAASWESIEWEDIGHRTTIFNGNGTHQLEILRVISVKWVWILWVPGRGHSGLFPWSHISKRPPGHCKPSELIAIHNGPVSLHKPYHNPCLVVLASACRLEPAAPRSNGRMLPVLQQTFARVSHNKMQDMLAGTEHWTRWTCFILSSFFMPVFSVLW